MCASGSDITDDLLDEVKYVDELIAAPLGDDPEPEYRVDEMLTDELFLTKFKNWDYEDEARRFVELSKAQLEDGRRFWPFDNDMFLREVILGPNCPAFELEPIRALVRATKAKAVASRARLAFGSFRVIPDGRYPPQ